MLKHEIRLIDPEHDTIATALTQTAAAANKRCRSRLLEDNPAKWKKFVKAVAEATEGYEMFRGGRGGVPATQVLAAWWTDAIGRKHVVMRGRRVEHDEAKRLLQKAELDKRPPLFHAYPEYVCRRTVNGVEQIVCACGCGAVGTPEALSWMGPMCGPCFDRKEELGPDGLRANVPGVLHGNREPLGAVVCSPDATRVAAKEGDTRVTYWDIPGRTRTTIDFVGQWVMSVALTSDGRHLLVAPQFTAATGGALAVFDLTTDPPTRVDSEHDPAGVVWQVCPMPQPELVLVLRDSHVTGGRVEVVRVLSGERVREVEFPFSHGWGTLSPDATRFLHCDFAATLLDVNTLRRVPGFGRQIQLAAFSSDSTCLFAWNGQLLSLDAGTGAVRGEGGKRAGEAAGQLTALAVDPGGEFVYGGNSQGRLCVFETKTLRLWGTLDWHLGPIAGLAVSADGSKLFSASGDGCVKVWPIRDLLRAG